MGIKHLTGDNWLLPDPAVAAFGRLEPSRGFVRMGADDWAERFLEVDIRSPVPEDVRALFDVARGTLLYGFFYYPLYALGEEQLHRVVETAVRHRYTDSDGPLRVDGRRPTFADRIDWLIERGSIPREESIRWHAMRELRNAASHPDFQMIQPPGEVLRSLHIVAESIQRLFSGSCRDVRPARP